MRTLNFPFERPIGWNRCPFCMKSFEIWNLSICMQNHRCISEAWPRHRYRALSRYPLVVFTKLPLLAYLLYILTDFQGLIAPLLMHTNSSQTAIESSRGVASKLTRGWVLSPFLEIFVHYFLEVCREVGTAMLNVRQIFQIQLMRILFNIFGTSETFCRSFRMLWQVFCLWMQKRHQASKLHQLSVVDKYCACYGLHGLGFQIDPCSLDTLQISHELHKNEGWRE